MKISFGLLLCFALVSCNFKKDNSAEKAKTTEEIARELRDQEEQQLISNKMQIGQFRIRVEPTPQANQYNLVVEWDKQNIRAEFTASISPDHDLKRSSTQSPMTFPLNGGDKFRLNIKAFSMKDSLVFDGSSEVSVPKDYIIGSSFRLSENSVIKADRLFIAKDVVITTLNYQLNIYANELVSLGGSTIENYSLTDSAPFQTPGQTGGTVIIKAKVARGSFFFYPRGQAGGHGLNGGVFPETAGRHPGCAPGSGANGGTGGTILLDIDDDSKFEPALISSRSAGGPRGIRGFIIYGTPNTSQVRPPPCDRDERDVSVDGAPGNSGTVCFISSTSRHQGCLTAAN